MLRIGLTGGIAAGKSTASRAFAELGAVVIDYDQLARDAVAPGSPVLADIAKVFGTGILHDDGSLNRPALATQMFNDDAARATLENLIHPRVYELAAEMDTKAVVENPNVIVIHDIPLLVEKELANQFDAIVIVQTNSEIRERRLIETRGLTKAEAHARIKAGATDAERQAAGTYFLNGNNSPENLRAQVLTLWQHLARCRDLLLSLPDFQGC